jgi:hypothetical protein
MVKSLMLKRSGAIVLSSLLALSCKGSLGDPDGDGPGGDDGCDNCTPSGLQVAESTRFPRLSHGQWENTVRDLFGLPTPTGFSSGFSPDALGGKKFDNNTDTMSVNSTLWADYQRAAEDVAALVTGDPALLANIAPATLPTDPVARRDAFLESFLARAFRRPAPDAEVARFAAVFDEGATHYPDTDPFTSGVRLTIEAVLQAPFFLYRPELGASDEDLVPLDDWEMASKLSYTLWGTMPDQALFEAAGRGDLTKTDSLAEQVDRMLADPRASETFRHFFDQVGHGDEYPMLDKSDSLYPDVLPETGAELREELARFVSHVIDSDGGFSELVTSRTTFVTPSIARIYGIDPATLTFDEDGFAEVELDPTKRAGLLTLAGFLAWRGTPAQPDTILRGVYLSEYVVCASVGDPPDEAIGQTLGEGMTNRERVENLTGPGTCGASCHGTVINPLGYAYEHYGAAGEWRDVDNGFPIDSSASFTFDGEAKSYTNAVELAGLIAESKSAHKCFAKSWIEFTMGRDLVSEDDGLTELLGEESHAGASVREMLRALLVSDAFRYRLARSGAEGEVNP